MPDKYRLGVVPFDAQTLTQRLRLPSRWGGIESDVVANRDPSQNSGRSEAAFTDSRVAKSAQRQRPS